MYKVFNLNYGSKKGRDDCPELRQSPRGAEFKGVKIMRRSIHALELRYTISYSEHQSFLTQGFPAVRFTEAIENFAHQHQDPRVQDGIQYGELLQFVDFDSTSRVAKNVIISTDVRFPAASEDEDPTLITNLPKFSWITGHDPLVDESYELVWRASTIRMCNGRIVLNVGNGGSVSVDLDKDNFQFGIRAVGGNGWKSPAGGRGGCEAPPARFLKTCEVMKEVLEDEHHP
ncbi:uncharacterized protein MYCFIDRAFT_175538 [Pseudocercospora fijiensis CIRAD86]|uniref:Uncharacterized protein n=1 Tax=Pseudocercospora fijiensis (strain CIRAD86) TaxID=383855 RepID=M3AWW6_PSEFD|nr:uncharacterized protein MYCFIDRAFT_175538 [Pseudocercospora fijiensis CIRAD86]EME81967.1 hypothetical protein MYCFIDRAFT_175538 [Pseudocercospora fijiensis CIRAD86]